MCVFILYIVVHMYICMYTMCNSHPRLEGVEARLQESSEAFEKSREMTKKSKIEYEKVKKMRYIHT